MTSFAAISGNTRSGTTLLQQLIAQHPSCDIFAQPFPQVFAQIKKLHLSSLGLESGKVIFPNFYQQNLFPEQLTMFLSEKAISKEFLLDSLKQYYSGQQTEGVIEATNSATLGGGWADAYCEILKQLSITSDSSPVVGSKHVMIEEYFNHFLSAGIKCINIVRDPRDMLASAKLGNANKYVGEALPTLFELRNWRKSAEFAIDLECNKDFLWIKYEDLILQTNATLERIFDFLALEHYDYDILSEFSGGSYWAGNSSFGKRDGISSASIGQSRNLFPKRFIEYVEVICHHEMTILGYEHCLPNDFASIISDFHEPVSVTSELVEKGYSTVDARVEYEIERIVNPDRGHFCFVSNYHRAAQKRAEKGLDQ